MIYPRANRLSAPRESALRYRRLAASVVLAGCFSPASPAVTGDADPGTSTTGSNADADADDSGPGGEASSGGDTEETSDGEAESSSGGADGEESGESGGQGCTTCDNPDPDHCVARCIAGACAVEAADADGDGHGDAECAPAPGDDCDDRFDTVFPGAAEICDSRDNDCNGLSDFDDGLTLDSEPVIVSGAAFAELSYSPDDDAYAVAYQTSLAEGFIATYDTDQSERAAPTPLVSLSGRIMIDWGGLEFRAFYFRGSSIPNFFTRPFDADGNIGNETPVSATAGFVTDYGIQALEGGGWGVVYRDGDIVAQLLGENGAQLGAAARFEFEGLRRTPRLAELSDAFAIAWDAGDTQLGLYDADFVETDLVTVTTSPPGAVYGTFAIGPMGDNVGVAYNRSGAVQRVEYMEYAPDGSIACGPVTLSDTSEPRIHNMDTRDGLAAVYLVHGTDWEIHRVRAGCEVVDSGVTIEEVSFFGEYGDVDLNESGIGVVSQIYDTGGNNPRISLRTFGPNLCDAPL